MKEKLVEQPSTNKGKEYNDKTFYEICATLHAA